MERRVLQRWWGFGEGKLTPCGCVWESGSMSSESPRRSEAALCTAAVIGSDSWLIDRLRECRPGWGGPAGGGVHGTLLGRPGVRLASGGASAQPSSLSYEVLLFGASGAYF